MEEEDMNLREKICNSINDMERDELKLLYEQITLLKSIKSAKKRKTKTPIEKIHEMTGTSRGSWSESVMEEREDRL